MFEVFYTTKMDSDKNRLRQRFEKMRQKADKKAKIISAFAAAFVLVSAFCASGAAFAAANRPKTDVVEILFDGAEKSLKSAPFVSNGEIYLPFREILNLCGVANDNISYIDGKISVVFYPERLNKEPLRAVITANEGGIAFNLDQNKRIMGINSAGTSATGEIMRSTTHPAVVLNGTTYVPCGMLIRLKNYYTANDFDDRIYLDLLAGLEIRLYDGEGKFDAVLCEPKPKAGGDKFSPESYYEEGEKVFVGTASDFQNFDFKHTEINGYYFPQNAEKRILVDEQNRVIAVFPYENFRHESVNPSGGGTSLWENALEYFPEAQDASLDEQASKPLFLSSETTFEKRGGFNIFLNVFKADENGNTQSRCLDYCFVDFRYFAENF